MNPPTTRPATAVLLGTLVVLALAVGDVVGSPAPRNAASAVESPVTVMAAGDIAESGTSSQANAKATGDLVRAGNPDYVLALGDLAYPDGSATDFATKYDPQWGSFKAKTRPTPGNHEYHADPPAGYLGYFGASNVTNSQDGGAYYAWDLGNGWRAYSLNATGSVSTSAGSAQERWLKADLAAHPGLHYLAYLHFPRYNSGTEHGQDTSQCPLWNDLLAAKADLVLAAHDHSYERWAKQDCSGNASASGIREFKSGGGGNQLYPFGAEPANLQARNNTDYGVLRLTLHSDSYDWAFLGSGRCWDGTTSTDCAANQGVVLDSGSAPTNIAASTSPAPAESATLHYTSNEGGSYAATTALGYDLHDTGMSASTVDNLPAGTRALVWAENGKCPTSLSSTFTSFVSAQASNPKVYGYFLVDEPSDTSAACVAGIKEMADYIHTHAPGKKAFVELTDYPGTYAAYAPSKSGADLIGLDPYPCRHATAACNYPDIHKQVIDAIAAGVPRAALVPTIQLFGDSVWSPPSRAQLQAILTEWHEELPSPAFDYSYSWGCPGGSLTDCMATHPEWQDTMKAWFSGAPAPSPSPSPMNHSPNAVADSVVTRKDVARTLTVTSNDTDADGDTLAVTDHSLPARGTVSCTPTTCTYTPAPGYTGRDSFTYTISDGHGGTDIAIVSVTVLPRASCRAAAPTIGRASPGARGGRATAIARWSAPPNACAAPLTGFGVTATRLNERGRVVRTRYFTTGPAARSLEMQLRRHRRWAFRATAVNALGRGTISARSNVVRAR